MVERVERPCDVLVSSLAVPDESINGRHQRARHHHEVEAQDANEIEQGVVARDGLPRLDAGDVDLWKSYVLTECKLAPAVL